MNRFNLILDTDSYKYSHYLQYPVGTKYLNAYIESRGGPYDELVFFGLQMFLKEYLSRPITQADIDEAEPFIRAHGEPFPREGWEIIVNEYAGYLPLRIQALPEGTIVAPHIPLVQVQNVDPRLPWLVGFIETAILRAVWYPTTVASVSRNCKKNIKKYLDLTSDFADAEINFKLHDFGARGVSSLESAGIGGCAHLVNFMGTDTVPALVYANRYYGADMAGFSIPASEHSTITSWGKENEREAFSNMIEQFGGENKIYACVSDSYNIWKAVDIWYSLKNQIIDKGGTLVIRPDSGDPVAVVSRLIETLMTKFGYSVNKKGFKVLPPYLRVIQGDGVNEKSIEKILEFLYQCGISASNIAFGMGGALLQQVNRDTLKFAYKCSAINKGNGVWEDVFKEPVTDSGKVSKKGIQKVVRRVNGGALLATVESYDPWSKYMNELRVVWQNGQLFYDQSFDEIRKNASL